MPNVKFSGFSAITSVGANGFIVGYDSVTNLNTRITLANLKTSIGAFTLDQTLVAGSTLTANRSILCNNNSFDIDQFSSMTLTGSGVGIGTCFKAIPNLVQLGIDVNNDTINFNITPTTIDISYNGAPNQSGIDFNYGTDIYKYGYLDASTNNDTYLRIDPSVLATVYGGVQDGLIFDYITRIFKFGGVSTYIQSNDIGYTIDTVLNSTIWGLSLDGTNAIFKLGDFGNQGFNNITIESNGTTERVTLQSNNEIYLDDNGTGVMISGTSSGASGNFLVINVNGTQYKIALDTP